MKKYVVLSLIALTAILYIGSRFWHFPKQQPTESSVFEKPQAIDYTMHSLQSQGLVQATSTIASKQIVAGITSHHLPVAENFIGKFYVQLKVSRPDIQKFLVVGPDHFEHCKTTASVTKLNFQSPYGLVENDQELTKALLGAGAAEDNSCFAPEHSVAVEITFIKKYFPDAKVTGLLFSSATAPQVPEQLAKVVAEKFPDVFVIESTDFSHYVTVQAANLVDARTQQQIERMDVSGLQLEQVDSPAALRFTVAYAKLLGATPKYLVHANSFDFTGNPDNTTGYFNVLFGK